MKKLSLIMLIAIVAISCKKDEKPERQYECVIQTTIGDSVTGTNTFVRMMTEEYKNQFVIEHNNVIQRTATIQEVEYCGCSEKNY